MKYQLVAADMDGTLLNDSSELTDRTKTAILNVVEAGALFVTATGRAFPGIEMINELFAKDMPFIVFNGATAIMGKSRKVLFKKYLDVTLTKEVYDLGIRYDVPMIVWTEKRPWASHECKVTDDYRKLYNIGMGIIGDIYDLEAEGIFKVLWFGTEEGIRQYQREMSEHFRGRLNCHASRPEFLEFVSLEADKGSALEEIGRIYGIERSAMIAVGDSYNDISMLKYAGLGVAVSNAPDEIKNVSNEVTLSNNEDGVAVVIEKYIL